MNIKDIKITVVDNDSLRAICSVNFDDLFVVHGIRLVEGKGKMFLSFPARIKKDGTFLDIAHPISSDFRDELTNKIIEKYNEADKQEANKE